MLSILLLLSIRLTAQYVAPSDPRVVTKLDQWQDRKFGLFMHWGPYSQWGVAESWTICPDEWVKRTGPYGDNYFNYKTAYEKLPETFNPIGFNPDKWAAAAKAAGMQYLVFTTKHHDGFCMFDTQQTGYKVTNAATPFSTNPKRDITRGVFDAFRNAGFMTGVYFSKPDWHSEYYWWPYFPPMGHDVNYDTDKHADRWNKFKTFTHKQIEELMTGYGAVDILWLDGGWVRPPKQDIDMASIAAMARKKQPGLIVVDRTVGGEYENYFTPEQEVPGKPLDYPWETCMTMGTSWSYSPNDQYKPSHQLIDLLVRIVSRGGNFLLNVGPDATGEWDPAVYARLKEIGRWMDINSEAIYSSRPVAPYSKDNIYFTQSKQHDTLYAFWMSDQEVIRLPTSIEFPVGRQVRSVSLLGSPQKLRWRYTGGKLHIDASGDISKSRELKHCAVFKINLH